VYQYLFASISSPLSLQNISVNIVILLRSFVCFWCNNPPVGHGLLIHEVSRSHRRRRTMLGRTPLGEWSARRRDLYLTTYNIYKRQTSIPPVGFEPTISAGVRQQTYALDRYWRSRPIITFVLGINPRHFCYLLSLRPKYSPLQSVRKQPQSM